MSSKQGVYHNLLEIYQQINAQYFSNEINASIRWGTSRSTTQSKKRSLRLGSYHPTQKSIRINPVLDQAFVPRVCIASIVYHEMLHQKHGVKRINGRRSIHPPAFLAEEKCFEARALVDSWFKENLNKLLAKKGY